MTEFYEPFTTFVKVYENIGFDRSVKKLDQSLWVCEIVFCADERLIKELKSKFKVGWFVVVVVLATTLGVLTVLFAELPNVGATVLGSAVVTVIFGVNGTLDDAVVIGTVLTRVGIDVVVVLVVATGIIADVVIVGDATILAFVRVGKVVGNVGAMVAELSVLRIRKISKIGC